MRLHRKTRAVTLIVVLSNALGNLSLSWGMKHGAELGISPLAVLRVLFNPWVMLGIALLIGWTISRLALLSWADLSYVLPVTALGYVLSAFSGRLFLGEQISWQRWAGTLLIVCGTVLVGMTPPRTTERT